MNLNSESFYGEANTRSVTLSDEMRTFDPDSDSDPDPDVAALLRGMRIRESVLLRVR